MKDKIIFWLDSDLTHFAIAKGIQDNYDAELFAVIDITDKPKSFFQTQQIVKFKKIWFYHDHIKVNKKPDMEYLQDFEKKYKISLWTLAYNERLFYQFNDYRKFTVDEVLSILEAECKLFETVIEEAKPDFLVMMDTTMHHNHLFYELCRAKGVKPLLLIPGTRIGRRVAISSIADGVDFLPKQIPSPEKNRTFEELRQYIKNFENYQVTEQINKQFLTSKSQLIKAAFEFLFRNKNENIKTHYSYYGRTKIRVLYKSICNLLKTKYRESFIDQNFIHEIKENEKFILFLLQQNPERSLLITAPFYTNELELLTSIVKSMPVGYKLYVKEHPAMRTREWRKISDYKYLMNLPNVRMIHPQVKPDELMKRCSVVMSISGTACFEAGFYQKPAIIFAETFFSRLSHIHKPDSIEDLPKAIRISLDKKITDPSELNSYIEIMVKNTFDFDYNKFVFDFADEFFFGLFLADANISEEKFRLFLDKNKEIIDDVALQHIKKIKQYHN
jgi:hypothetical protein